ncbi:two-component system sensor histidine kinase NtrB [Terrirubrum flagellatum]|uniref:two-component system sensor histidine kinase NtrB n=1 Tax=Terrirubrum flagellatum TaxID=2895980 RepID=UPI003CC837E1
MGDSGMNAGYHQFEESVASASSRRADAIVRVMPTPIIVVDEQDHIIDANPAAETFLGVSLAVMRRYTLPSLLPARSPLVTLIEDVRRQGASVSGYDFDLGTPRTGDRSADVFAGPVPDAPGQVVVMLQERTIAEKMGRQLNHRSAARSVTALASMLAHEIKNPLSGIKGAAQLLESSVTDADRMLTTLICDETERIVKLVDGMDLFSDTRPIQRDPVNVHEVLEHVKRLAQTGVARHIRFVENYDPSLPRVMGNRDQLIQVFFNLVKNAAEAIGEHAIDGEVILSSAFRPGIRMTLPSSTEKVALPLEFTVRDNGAGIAADILPHLFDPFLTTKTQGSGLGLALVAKIIGDHGGAVSCESSAGRTTFKVLLPMAVARDGRAADE